MNSTSPLSIVHVNTTDLSGGAEKSAYNLFIGQRRLGHQSWFVVGNKRLREDHIFQIPARPKPRQKKSKLNRLSLRVLNKLERSGFNVDEMKRWQQAIFLGRPAVEKMLGIEDFNFPASKEFLELLPHKPDIIHLHNLHRNYFDLRQLPALSRKIPVIANLHDAWMLSGHCAHSFDCPRWKTGCGQCPDLDIYPPIERDASAYNWRRKKRIYKKSRLYISTPSEWLMNKVKKSMLSGVDYRVIHNAVDQSIFYPQNRQAARNQLGLPLNAKIILFVARDAKNNRWKDYDLLEKVVRQVADQTEFPLNFVCLGSKGDTQQLGNLKILFTGPVIDHHTVASYYNAADLYVHAAKADTFPRTILEALSCGIPVVANRVGGVPEQIKHGQTGFLVPSKDVDSFTSHILKLIKDSQLHTQFSHAAATDAKTRFSLETQIQSFVNWYYEILSARC